MTKVIFLHDFNYRETIAFFPEEMYNSDPDLRMAYSHVGQHSSCHLDYARKLPEATPEQYEELLRELKNDAGYTDLTIATKGSVFEDVKPVDKQEKQTVDIRPSWSGLLTPMLDLYSQLSEETKGYRGRESEKIKTLEEIKLEFKKMAAAADKFTEISEGLAKQKNAMVEDVKLNYNMGIITEQQMNEEITKINNL